MKSITLSLAVIVLPFALMGCGNPHAEDPNGKFPPTGTSGTAEQTTSDTDPAQAGVIHTGNPEQPMPAPSGR